MIHNLINTNSCKEKLNFKIQDLKQECSSKSIGGKKCFNKLCELLLDDIKFVTRNAYDNYLIKRSNEGYEISANDLPNEIQKFFEENIFNDYISEIQGFNAGNMINMEIKESDIKSFKEKAINELRSQCDKIKAEYKNVLTQQEYNKKILSFAKTAAIASIVSIFITIFLFILDHYKFPQKILIDLNNILKFIKKAMQNL